MAHVQQANTGASYKTGSAVGIAFPATVTSGNAVVGLFSYDDTITLNSVTDDKSNTYTILDTIHDTTNGQKSSSFVLGNITNAPITVTANFSGSGSFIFGAIDEYSGVLASSNPTDGHTGQLQAVATGTDTASSGSITTTVNGDQIWGGFANTQGTSSANAAGTNYTLRNSQIVGAFTNAVATEDRTQTTAGTIAATLSPTVTATVNWTNFVIALKPASAASVSIAPGGFFERSTLLPRKSEFMQGPFRGTSPALATTFATSAFFEPTRLKRPVMDDKPPLFKPAVVTTSIVEQPFFDTIRLKQPVIDRPADMRPLIGLANLSASNFFDAVKLRPVPERFGELYPQQYWTPQAFDAWFDQRKVLKIRESLQEAFGVPFQPGQSLTAWFDQVQKLKVPAEFPFTATGATQLNTIRYALTAWFDQVRLKQPTVETPLILYFPAQVIPVDVEHHDLPFFATPGSLMTR